MYFELIRRRSTISPNDAACCVCKRPILISLEDIDPEITEMLLYCSECAENAPSSPSVVIGSCISSENTSFHLAEIQENNDDRLVYDEENDSLSFIDKINSLCDREFNYRAIVVTFLVIYLCILFALPFIFSIPNITRAFFMPLGITIAIYIGYFYLSYRLLNHEWSISNLIRRSLHCVLLLLVIIIASFPFMTSILSKGLSDPSPFTIFSSYCMVLYIFLVCFVILSDLVYLIWILIEWISTSFCSCCFAPLRENIQNKKLYWKIAIALSILCTFGLTISSIIVANLDPRIYDVIIPLPRFPASLDGYTIVELSDIHMGQITGATTATKIVEKVNELSPNAIVIAGDFTDNNIDSISLMMEPFKLFKAIDGVYFATGNHDGYYSDINDWTDYIRNMNIIVLNNSFVTLPNSTYGGFDLAGIAYESPDYDTALIYNRNSSNELILLSHVPKGPFDDYEKLDFIISGHTHGGQIYPISWISKLILFPCVMGLCRQNSHALLYVSQGTSHWLPIRLGTYCEITRFHLRNLQMFIDEGGVLPV